MAKDIWVEHLSNERDYWLELCAKQHKQLKWVRVRWAVFGILLGAAAMRWWSV